MNSLWDIRIFLGLVPKESPCIVRIETELCALTVCFKLTYFQTYLDINAEILFAITITNTSKLKSICCSSLVRTFSLLDIQARNVKFIQFFHTYLNSSLGKSSVSLDIFKNKTLSHYVYFPCFVTKTINCQHNELIHMSPQSTIQYITHRTETVSPYRAAAFRVVWQL
jgi:hypothetical protein